MTQKVRKILIMVVMAALIICLMAASLNTFTYGRYAGGKFDEESPYDDLIEFVGANQYTVRTPEELIQAIEDGYSNIKIADDAEEPFVIDTGVTDVSANLVLDVNGKTLIRNSRNPMLDVQTNVSVVLIYDSSDEEQGGFYNPVGSALQASGGTLTVGSGNYDDGPKKEEYNEYNGINSNHGTLGGSNPSVTLYARDNAPSGHPGLTTAFRATTKRYTHVEIDSLPTITPKIVEGETDDASDIVYGNIYLENGSTLNTNWLPADTFLLYTEEQGELVIGKLNGDGDVVLPGSDGYDGLSTPEQIYIQNGDEVEALSVACDVASCDFYYYYDTGDWIGADGKRHQGERPTTGFTPIYAVIYGYWDVMALARDDKENETDAEGMATALMDRGLVYPFAAVRMVEGEGFARGGQFSNNFGTVNSYGIYANGGALTASGANFTTGGDGVCIRCEGSASLSIGGGTYSSAIGNTIEMEGGKMTVTKGTFKKSGGKGIGSGSGEDQAKQQVANQTAMIDMQGGKLNVSGTKTDDTYSVTMTAGGDDNGDTLTNVFGILAHSGGEVSVGGCTFNINGNYSAGVLSYDGTINLKDNTVITVKEEHPGYRLTSAGVSSERSEPDTSATSSSTEEHPINMEGNVTITSNGLGITARGMINVKSGTTTVKTENATGIVVSGDADEKDTDRQATLTVSAGATLSVESKINSSLKWVNAPGHEGTGDTNVNNGIYVENGSIDASAGTLNVTHTGVAGDTPTATTGAATKSYAVFVKGDTASNNQTTTVSIGAGTITGTYAGGVYVVGTSKQDGEQTTYTATVTLGGVTVTAKNTYAAGILTETGNVIINGNAQITSSALGIAVINGNVGISADSTDSSVTATRATGVYVRGGTLYNRGTLSVTSDLADENSNNSFYQHTGADISTPSTDPNPYNGVYVKGGSLESTGTLNVTFTGVQNESKYDIDTLLETYGITLPTIGEDGTGRVSETFYGDDEWYGLFETYQEYTPSFQEVQQAVSYAVRVEAGESANTTVTIDSGNITNSVGGGVYVGGGEVTLGETDLEIHAEGDQTIDKKYIYSINRTETWILVTTMYEYTIEVRSAMYFAEIDNPAQNWAYRENQTGGDAVRVEGGTLTIEGGEYTSAQGNGIVAVGGTTTIKGGTFNGSDNYQVADNSGLVVPAGPAASYAFKVYGGEITVNAGTFGDPDSTSGASGGFVMGTSADHQGIAKINGGTFAVSNGNTGGQAGFGVYRYANVTFGQEDTTGDIQVTGLAAGLVLERTPGDSGTTVTINRGTFSSTRTESGTSSDGVWYGNGTSKLNIKGGKFTGAGRSGIQLDENPSYNVKITGGTFVANQGYPISGYYNQVVPQGYGIISGSNNQGQRCTIGAGGRR